MLDNRTLITIELLIPFAFMIIQLVEFGWKAKGSIKTNILANLFQFIGYLLIGLGNKLPPFFSTYLSNTSIIVSSILMLVTTFMLFNIKVPIKRFVFMGLFGSIFILFSFNNKPMFKLDSHIVSLGLAMLFMYGVVVLYLKTPRSSRHLLISFLVIFLLLVITMLFRFLVMDLLDFDFKSTRFLNQASSLFIISLSFLILIWNYSIQLKRGSCFKQELEESVTDLLKTQGKLTILNSFYRGSRGAESLEALYPKIFDLIYEYFSIEKAALFIKEDKLKPVYYRGIYNSWTDIILNLDPKTSATYRAYNNNEIVQMELADIPDGPLKDYLIEAGLHGFLAFPLYVNNKGIGALSVGISSESSFNKRDRELFVSICNQIAGVIYNSMIYNELIATQAKLELIASTDSLTGIINRREFYRLFKKELGSTKRHNDIMCLFIIDLDDFKKVNDTFGHDAGDLVLKSVVNNIKTNLRESDIFARYGGEEFIGVLSRSQKVGAISKLKNLVEEVSKIKINEYPKISITISVGCCFYSDELNRVEDIIKKADISLYKAKKRGKNRVCSN